MDSLWTAYGQLMEIYRIWRHTCARAIASAQVSTFFIRYSLGVVVFVFFSGRFRGQLMDRLWKFMGFGDIDARTQ